MSLIQDLLKKEIIDKNKATSLEYETNISGKKEEEVILEKGLVSEAVLFGMKSKSLNIPLQKSASEEIPLNILEFIPRESAQYYRMAPLGREDKFLQVGMVYPEDLKAQEALKFLARQQKFDFKVFLITPTVLNNILKQYRTLKKEVTRALEELEVELKTGETVRPEFQRAEFERMAEEAPITKMVAVMLRHAVEGKASDIHIEPTKKELRIRFRLDGILHASLFLPLKIHLAVIARIKILANLKIDEIRMPQDGRFSAKIGEKNIDFRVSTFPTILGEKAVLRVLDPIQGIKNFEELGIERRNFEVIQKAIKKPFGMILATGPTGSGKTTTLYAILSVLNREGVNIITMEDPVEYFVEGVNQSQIRPEIGYTFATGLRHILRQDPNVIMVGEIRDQETATLATHAALTGHIVLSTLHTTNALGVIPRLIDLGVAPFLLPSSLSVAIAQRLLRLLCPECKQKIQPDPKVKEMILKEIEFLPLAIKKDLKIPHPFVIYKAKGCKKCRNEGYSGRMGVFEILEMTPQLAEIVLKEPTESRISEEAKRQGMITMQQDGILKVLEGVTSIEEILRVTQER